MWYVSYFNEKLFVTQSVQNIMQRTVQRVRCFHVSRQLFKQKSIENKASNIKAIVNQTDLPKETDAHMIRLAKLMAQKG
jgi:hypothetical protein